MPAVNALARRSATSGSTQPGDRIPHQLRKSGGESERIEDDAGPVVAAAVGDGEQQVVGLVVDGARLRAGGGKRAGRGPGRALGRLDARGAVPRAPQLAGAGFPGAADAPADLGGVEASRHRWAPRGRRRWRSGRTMPATLWSRVRPRTCSACLRVATPFRREGPQRCQAQDGDPGEAAEQQEFDGDDPRVDADAVGRVAEHGGKAGEQLGRRRPGPAVAAGEVGEAVAEVDTDRDHEQGRHSRSRRGSPRSTGTGCDDGHAASGPPVSGRGGRRGSASERWCGGRRSRRPAAGR